MACPGRSSALSRFPVWSGGAIWSAAETDKAGASSRSGGGLLQLDTTTRECQDKKEAEGQLGQKRREEAQKQVSREQRQVAGGYPRRLPACSKRGWSCAAWATPPRLLTRRRRVFLSRAELTTRMARRISSSVPLAEAWSVVISTRDGHPRQDGGGVENSSSSS